MKDRSKCKHKNTIPVFEPHEKPEKYIVFRCADCDMAKNKKGEWIIIDRKNSDMDCLDCKIRLPEWESRFVAFGYILTDALEKIAKNRVGRIGETTTANECAVLAKEALNKFKKGVKGDIVAGELELKKFVNDTVRPFFNRKLPDIMGRISTISIVMNDLKARVEKLEAQINQSMSIDEAIASVQPKAKKAKKTTKAKE